MLPAQREAPTEAQRSHVQQLQCPVIAVLKCWNDDAINLDQTYTARNNLARTFYACDRRLTFTCEDERGVPMG